MSKLEQIAFDFTTKANIAENLNPAIRGTQP